RRVLAEVDLRIEDDVLLAHLRVDLPEVAVDVEDVEEAGLRMRLHPRRLRVVGDAQLDDFADLEPFRRRRQILCQEREGQRESDHGPLIVSADYLGASEILRFFTAEPSFMKRAQPCQLFFSFRTFRTTTFWPLTSVVL